MKMRCELCFHHCALDEGQTGFCRARACQDGKIVSLNYGKLTSLALDPIEKKPLRRTDDTEALQNHYNTMALYIPSAGGFTLCLTAPAVFGSFSKRIAQDRPKVKIFLKAFTPILSHFPTPRPQKLLSSLHLALLYTSSR